MSNAGDGAGGLTASREAVDIYRRLARDIPMRFAPNLAQGLSHLSVLRSNAGDYTGALTASREAVHTYRQLAQDDVPAWRPPAVP